jgi:hypothetical protein
MLCLYLKMNCYLIICIRLKDREDLKKKKFPIENESEKQRVKWDLSEIKFTTKTMQRKTNISLQWCKISSKWWDSTFCSLECESHRVVHKDIECFMISMKWGRKSTALLSHLFYHLVQCFSTGVPRHISVPRNYFRCCQVLKYSTEHVHKNSTFRIILTLFFT